MHVRQIPHLNCLASKLPDHKDLAFKLKRKQFTIEVRCQAFSAYTKHTVKVSTLLSESDFLNVV